MLRKFISMGLVLLLSGCGSTGPVITGPGELQTALEKAGINCNKLELYENESSVSMHCRDDSESQERFSFGIWESAEALTNHLPSICETMDEYFSYNQVAMSRTVTAGSDSLLVDLDTIAKAISGETGTWLEHCQRRGFDPVIKVNEDRVTEVTDVVGLDHNEAGVLLEAEYLQVLRVFEKSPKLKGIVLRQEPESGTVVSLNAPVTLYVSSGGG